MTRTLPGRGLREHRGTGHPAPPGRRLNLWSRFTDFTSGLHTEVPPCPISTFLTRQRRLSDPSWWLSHLRVPTRFD